MRRHLLLGLTALVAVSAALGGVASVSAHDVHPFGPYTVALGWLHEPAYTGVDNAVQVLIKDADGKPVTDITDRDLTVDVSLDRVALPTAPLKPTADPDTGLGTPGEYEFHFIPTAPGNYTFHVRGVIKGTAVDDNVTAGDRTFAQVTGGDAVQFPTKVPAASDLSRKVDSLSAQLALASSSQQSAANDARDAANRALTIGVIAVVLALAAGLVGVILGRRSRP